MNKHYKRFAPSFCAVNLYIGMKSSLVEKKGGKMCDDTF